MSECGLNLKGATSATAEVLLPGSRDSRVTTVLLLAGQVYVRGHWLGRRDALEDDGRFRLIPEGVHEEPLVVLGPGIRTARADRRALWSGARVPYVIDNAFSAAIQGRIEEAIRFYQDNTPLRWIPTSEDDSMVRFKLWNDSGRAAGNSAVGRVGGTQHIQLVANVSVRTVIHEMGHAIGLLHEQSRPDRNSYVRIIEENIQDPDEFAHNFDRFSAADVTPLGNYNHRSVMHYSANAFANDGTQTIVPIAPPEVTANMLGSNAQFDASERSWLRKLYPLTTLHTAGSGWGDSRGVTALTFGRFTRPGVRDQLLVARNAGSNQRLAILDDEGGGFAQQMSLEDDWGESRYATAVLAADVDGDGLDEIIVGRNAGGNMRIGIKKLNAERNGYDTKLNHDGWGESVGVSSLAYGRDSDGTRLLLAGRKTTAGPRYILYRINEDGGDFSLDPLWSAGDNWADSVRVTDVALADVDGDGWLELVIATNSSSESVDRLFVLDDRHQPQPHRPIGAANDRIPAGLRITALAAVDLDNDGRAELVVGTDAGPGHKLFVLDNAHGEFAVKSAFGKTLRNDAFITCVAAADLDGDGMAEIVVGLSAPKGPRALVLGFDDVSGGDWPLYIEDDLGRGWGSNRSTSAIAVHVQGNRALVATGRDPGGNSRYALHRWNIR